MEKGLTTTQGNLQKNINKKHLVELLMTTSRKARFKMLKN